MNTWNIKTVLKACTFAMQAPFVVYTNLNCTACNNMQKVKQLLKEHSTNSNIKFNILCTMKRGNEIGQVESFKGIETGVIMQAPYGYYLYNTGYHYTSIPTPGNILFAIQDPYLKGASPTPRTIKKLLQYLADNTILHYIPVGSESNDEPAPDGIIACSLPPSPYLSGLTIAPYGQGGNSYVFTGLNNPVWYESFTMGIAPDILTGQKTIVHTYPEQCMTLGTYGQLFYECIPDRILQVQKVLQALGLFTTWTVQGE